MRITLDQVFEQLRSLECEYITRTERAEFRGEEVTATETMRVSEVIASTMSNLGGSRVRHEGRYRLDTGGTWGIIEDLTPGPLPRSLKIEVVWREATQDEIDALPEQYKNRRPKG